MACSKTDESIHPYNRCGHCEVVNGSNKAPFGVSAVLDNESVLFQFGGGYYYSQQRAPFVFLNS
jgi:hypothetical protein